MIKSNDIFKDWLQMFLQGFSIDLIGYIEESDGSPISNICIYSLCTYNTYYSIRGDISSLMQPEVMMILPGVLLFQYTIKAII